MTERSKPTPGPWTVRKVKRTTFICDENGNYIAAIKPVRRFGIAGDDDANVRLMVEAGTMHGETRLTPQQMREQRDELLAAVKSAVRLVEEDIIRVRPSHGYAEAREAFNAALASMRNQP